MSKKISELTQLNELSSEDIFAGVDISEDSTVKVTAETVKNYTSEIDVGAEEPTNGKTLWVEASKNLFDKNNYTEANGTPNNNVFTGGGTNYCIIMECNTNTTYTIQKRNDGDINRFAAATSEVIPSSVSSSTTTISDYIRNDGANTLTITTGNSAKYLIVHYYRSNETTLTKEQLLNSVMIEEGSTASSYEPYITPNIKANINGSYETICSKPVVLWQNPNPASTFGGQTVTLNEQIENFKYYTVVFNFSASEQYSNTFGIIPITSKGFNTFTSTSGANLTVFRRLINSITGTSCSFSLNSVITTSSTTTDNSRNIPLMILGYERIANNTSQPTLLAMGNPNSNEEE